jgi:hypothetical protein
MYPFITINGVLANVLRDYEASDVLLERKHEPIGNQMARQEGDAGSLI